jgi:hypothetical protein
MYKIGREDGQSCAFPALIGMICCRCRHDERIDAADCKPVLARDAVRFRLQTFWGDGRSIMLPASLVVREIAVSGLFGRSL